MKNNGFSLVELSIVLVILGLLVGGIMTGQNLIHAAELRSITTEYNKYQTGINLFRDKYFSLPGDMPNAKDFWGVADVTPATCATTASTGMETCDGDGNGEIIFSNTLGNESFRFWQHLANAGLIEGTFTGVSTQACAATAHCAEMNINIPASKFSNAGWTIGTRPANVNRFGGEDKNAFFFGIPENFTSGRVISTEDAWNLDTKMDDGRPGIGIMRTYTFSRHGNCASTDVEETAVYQLDQTGIECALIFDSGTR